MTLNQRLIAAITPLGIAPVPNVYTGTAQEYITFNYTTLPDDYADDAPQHERYLVQVHYIVPLRTDRVAFIRQLKTAIRDAGLLYPMMIDATDKDGQHYVFECEIAEGV